MGSPMMGAASGLGLSLLSGTAPLDRSPLPMVTCWYAAFPSGSAVKSPAC